MPALKTLEELVAMMTVLLNCSLLREDSPLICGFAFDDVCLILEGAVNYKPTNQVEKL